MFYLNTFLLLILREKSTVLKTWRFPRLLFLHELCLSNVSHASLQMDDAKNRHYHDIFISSKVTHLFSTTTEEVLFRVKLWVVGFENLNPVSSANPSPVTNTQPEI